jgi:hypothetical protein
MDITCQPVYGVLVTMPSTDSSAAGPSPRQMRAFKVIALLVALFFIGLVAWALWTASRPSSAPPTPPFDRFEAGWTSAMAKAGVEATFPAGPVRLENVQHSGRRPFEATFTAEEISALLGVYRYETTISGTEVALRSARASFPSAGTVELNGTLLTGGSAYQAQASAPITYSSGEIRTTGLTSLVVEGFTIGGDRRRQAQDALLEYFNRYLDAAPGLAVDSAEAIEGGVRVVGFAPTKVVHLPD